MLHKLCANNISVNIHYKIFCNHWCIKFSSALLLAAEKLGRIKLYQLRTFKNLFLTVLMKNDQLVYLFWRMAVMQQSRYLQVLCNNCFKFLKRSSCSETRQVTKLQFWLGPAEHDCRLQCPFINIDIVLQTFFAAAGNFDEKYFNVLMKNISI